MPSSFNSAVVLTALALALLALEPVLAHVGIWHPSVYGYSASGREPEHWYDSPTNTNWIKNPLRLDDNLKYSEWFFRGLQGATPEAVMDLPVGETITIETSCNKAFTSYGLVPEQLAMVGDLPCDINVKDGHATYGDPNVPASNGPLHTADASDTGGCALAIAYTDDIWSVKPEDLTVFSVQQECVWKRETTFDIPADMPPCPNGKCICSWQWQHKSQRGEGYANELYMVGFDCNVLNSKSSKALAKPQVPVECRNDASKCVKGAKQPMYWQGAQLDGWNVPTYDGMLPPTYTDEWGFSQGSQDDIFTSGPASSDDSASSSSAATPEPTRKAAYKADSARHRVNPKVHTVTSTRTHLVTVGGPEPTQRMKRQVGPSMHKRRLDGRASIAHDRQR